MSLTSFIASLGTNPDFVAFWAHAGVYFAILTFFPHLWLAGVLLAIAGVKEFWFDATYEVPKQTFFENVTDFIGYAFGILLWFAKTY